MEKRTGRRRWLIATCLMGVAIVVVAYVALRIYLSSEWVVARVTSELEKFYGDRVTVESASIGVFGSSSVAGLRLYEAKPQDTAWLEVKDVSADLSAWEMLTGTAEPSQITLDGATLTLRWDKDGNFVSRWPSAPEPSGDSPQPMPQIKLRDSRLVLQKAGQVASKIEGIQGTLVAEGDQYVLRGKISEEKWGDWKIDGSFGSGKGLFTLKLTPVNFVTLTDAKLQGLPFIADQVWKNIRPQGKSSGEVLLTWNMDTGKFDYRVEVQAVDNTVTLPGMGVTMKDISEGKVIIEGTRARIHQLQGRSLGGRVSLSGEIDYGKPELHVDLPKVTVSRVPVANIPERWKFPLRMEGNLSAEASFSAVMHQDHVKVLGQVDGRIKKESDTTPKATFELKVNATAQGITWGQGKPDPKEEKKGKPKDTTEPPPKMTSLFQSGLQAVLFSQVLLLQQSAEPGKKTPKANQPEKKNDKIELKLSLNEVDLAETIKTAKIKLPFPVKGTVSLKAKVGIPPEGFGDLQKYSATGTATANNLQIADLFIESAKAQIDYDKGVLQLEQFEAVFPQKGGSFVGTAKMGVLPLGQLTAQLMAKEVALQAFASLLQDKTAGGNFSGQVDVSVPVEKFQDPTAWNGTAKVASETLTVSGLTLKSGRLEMQVKDGVTNMTTLKGKLEGTPVSGTAKLALKDKYPFQAKLEVPEGQLDVLEKLPKTVRPLIGISGKLDATVKASGTLQPFSYNLAGTVKATRVKVYKTTFEKAEFGWTLDGQMLKITDLTGQAYDGRVNGSATIPLAAKQDGAINLNINQMQAKAMAKELKLPFTLAGEINGTLKANESPSVRASLDLASKELKFQGVAVDNLKADVQLKQQEVFYTIRSKALGGTIEAEGKVPLPKKPKEPVGDGVLRMTNVNLDQVWRLLNRQPVQAVPLTGIANLRLTYRHGPTTFLPTGSGELTITNLKWERLTLAPTVKADITVRPGALGVDNVRAQLAGGSLKGKLTWDLEAPSRSRFNVTLDRAAAGKLPLLKDALAGPVGVKLSGVLGRTVWYGRGELNMARGEVWGVPTKSLRMPLHWRFSPASGRGRVMAPQATAVVARGRASGHGSLTWGSLVGLDTKVRFTNVELGRLVRQTTKFGTLGQARITGNLKLSGHNLRSLRDLRGSLRGDFARTQALTFPVLRRVAPLIGQAPSTAFNAGKLRATISNGAFRVQELKLASNTLQLFAEGLVTFDQRLNLDVLARTGQQGTTNYQLRFLASRIPAIGPVPVGVLVGASRILNNRVVYMDVTGTLGSPVIRVRPVQTLSANAVRFFVEQALPVPGSGGQ